MAEMTFTPAQQNAIHVQGGAVIVSAAAGSGKTRVLVQRVLEMLTNNEHPVPADRLLIVTFTNAAADEMKRRMMAEIERLMSEQPENMFLRHQQILLMNADICTIHSFCSRLVRENFFSLDINQDFRIAQDTELAAIKYRIMSDIIERMYKENSQPFKLLSAIFSGAKSDKRLENTLLDIYTKSISHPDMEQWLDSAAALYDPNIPLKETVFARIVYDMLESSVSYFNIMLETADTVISQNQDAFCTGKPTCGENKYNYLQSFIAQLERLAKNKDWNAISAHISAFEKKKYIAPRSKKTPVSFQDLQAVKNSFSNIDREIQEKLLPVFGITEEVYQNDTIQIYPAVCCMCDIIKEFSKKFFEKKKEKGILDFSDLEHLALQLLSDPSSDRKSELAESISKKYDAVMIDEFQDTNEIQDRIFKYISQNETNIFVVGDVKQSIYRFREAMPEIFKERRKKSILYHEGTPQFPACIILDKNFRSRENIIDSVNFVFHAVMSEYVGEIEYNDNEKLTVGADYPPSNSTEMEIHLLDAHQADDSPFSGLSKYQKEALYVAETIKKMMADGMEVAEKGEMRPVRYSDFCILMRYMKGHSQEYADMMNRAGIPTYVDQPYSLFECYEVNMVISFLKAVDNRLLDIPLLAVMLCPICGFTPDDLACLKVRFKAKHLYSRIYLCSGLQSNNDSHNTALQENTVSESLSDEERQYQCQLQNKCVSFVRMMEEFRKLSITLSISELADTFFEKTGYLSVVSAMTNGEVRVKNVHKLMSFIRDYENGSKGSLSDFVRHVAYLEESETEITVSDSEPDNSVKIISIHRSKGLEFPICILAGLDMTGNTIPPDVYCHKRLGFGMKMTETDTMFKYNTLQRNIIRQITAREELSESMRILYVAMTRAKEKLLAVVTVDSKEGIQKKLQTAASYVKITNGRLDEHCVENASTLDNWILMCAMVHPCMDGLRREAGIDEITPIPTKSVWKYIKGTLYDDTILEENTDSMEQAEPDKDFMAFLQERFSQEYPHQSRTAIPAKVSASALAHNQNDTFDMILSRPSFMQEHQLTGAEKGTAMHTFLQYADFSQLAENGLAEKQRLLHIGRISQEQYDCISQDDIVRFTVSNTCQYILSAQRAEREYRFTVNIPASEVGEQFAENTNEQVILQGAMDCIAINSDGIVIIDYKTDNVKNVGELKKRYQKQLDLYKKAAEQIFALPVKKCIIYSVKLGEEIEF